MKYVYDYINPKFLSEFKAKTAQNRLNAKKLSLKTYGNAVAIPAGRGSACSGVYVDDAKLPFSDFDNTAPDKLKGVGPIQESDECVFYLGMFFACWGHCLTDDLRHLWPIVDGLLPANVKFVYTATAPDEKLPANFVLMLNAVGVDRTKVMRIDKPTRFKELIFAEPSYWMSQELGGRYFTNEFARTVDAIRNFYVKTNSPQTRKVYFTRAGWHVYKPDVGEVYVEQAFRDKGFEIVRPETLSFPEMLNLLSETKVFASTECSCQLNSIFLPKGSEVVVIRKAEYTEDVQIVVNQMRDLTATNIDANLSTLKMNPQAPWQGPFFMYVNERLARYLGVKKQKFPWRDYLVYFRAFIRMRGKRLLSQIKHSIVK